MRFWNVSLSLFALVLTAVVPDGVIGSAALPTEAEWRELVANLAGEDIRVFRWDALEHTANLQLPENKGCAKLPEALAVLTIDESVNTLTQKALAAEYVSLCVTDNPENRAEVSRHPGIHKAIVNLVSTSDAPASAAASNVIYSASFANRENHQGFIAAGAVEALSTVIKSKDSNLAVTAAQIMWATVALQNLAASYCEGTEDKRCEWDWTEESGHVEVTPESLPVLSDGHEARETLAKDVALIELLKELVCTGPVQGEASEANPFPSENAVRGIHENHPNLLPFAAMGALKNLALEPDFGWEWLENIMDCLCLMSHSADGLEQEKAVAALHTTRRSDPCFMDPDDEETVECVDHWFVSEGDGYHCGQLSVEENEDDCAFEDTGSGETASDACCICGGGYRDGAADEL